MLQFRKAIKSDVDILFKWANDPKARNNSFNKEPIKYKEHVDWLNTELKNDNSIILIFERDNNSIGVVRFHKERESWTISINIDEKQRGKGNALKMLKKSASYFFNYCQEDTINAFIKKENLASIKVFEKSGYKYHTSIFMNDKESLHYKLTRNDFK
jgi:RimJ/RimL family protein N-acetyltransferase